MITQDDRGLEDISTLLDLFPNDPDRLNIILCLLQKQRKLRDEGLRDHRQIETILEVMERSRYN